MGFKQVQWKEKSWQPQNLNNVAGLCYPVGEEELSLGSQEVGQIAIFAVFHDHHQRACVIEAQNFKSYQFRECQSQEKIKLLWL